MCAPQGADIELKVPADILDAPPVRRRRAAMNDQDRMMIGLLNIRLRELRARHERGWFASMQYKVVTQFKKFIDAVADYVPESIKRMYNDAKEKIRRICYN